MSHKIYSVLAQLDGDEPTAFLVVAPSEQKAEQKAMAEIYGYVDYEAYLEYRDPDTETELHYLVVSDEMDVVREWFQEISE